MYDVSVWLSCISHDISMARLLHEMRREGGTLYVRPRDIQRFGLLDYDRVEEIVQLGRDALRRALDGDGRAWMEAVRAVRLR